MGARRDRPRTDLRLQAEGQKVAFPPDLPASSEDRPRYSVVVPVFNEAANIAALCRRARDELPPDFELLICYDHDNDNTLPAVRALPEDEKPAHIRLIKNDLGPGVRYAIEAGMRAAAAPIVVVTM